MSSMDSSNEGLQPIPEAPADPAQKRAKQVFLGFAATVIVGLTLAGWYVGGRIFTAEKVHAATSLNPARSVAPVPKAAPVVIAQPSTPVVAEPVPEVAQPEPVALRPSAPAPVSPKAEPVAVLPADPTPAWRTIQPQSGELYLQLAAMGPNSTNEYLKILDAKGIYPKIAPGPSDNLHRLLIGPYPDKAALEKQQHDLEAAGIQFFERRY